MELLKEIYRVLKPGGWFRLVDNDKRFFEIAPPAEKMPFDKGHMSRKELWDNLSKVGFKNIIQTNTRETNLEDKSVLIAENAGHPGFALEMYK